MREICLFFFVSFWVFGCFWSLVLFFETFYDVLTTSLTLFGVCFVSSEALRRVPCTRGLGLCSRPLGETVEFCGVFGVFVFALLWPFSFFLGGPYYGLTIAFELVFGCDFGCFVCEMLQN